MKWSRLAYISLIVGSIFWNTWILGWLNHGSAGYVSMYISELSVINQPYYQFFTITEYLSGILILIAAAFLLLVRFRKRTAVFILIVACMALVGGLTIYDAANPLDCNRYDDPMCVAKDTTGNVSVIDKHHNVESAVTDVVTALLGLFTLFWAYRIGLDKRTLASLAIICVIIFLTSSVLDIPNHIVANAIAQRIWNVCVSIDLVTIGYFVYKKADDVTALRPRP